MFRRDRLIKDAPTAPAPLLPSGMQAILGPMSDAVDLARRFLTLWEDYLAALLSDPARAGVLTPWDQIALARAGDPGLRDGPAGQPAKQPGSPARAAAVADPPGERDHLVAELARRIADLEERVTGIERTRRADPQSRRRNRGVRVR